MINEKSKKETRIYRLVKWGLFVPSLLGLLLYVFGLVIGFYSIKATKPEHTKEDVKNARKWFLHLAIPFFGYQYFGSFLTTMDTDVIQRMHSVYGKRRYISSLKMYFPIIGKKMDAFEAMEVKTGNTYEILA